MMMLLMTRTTMTMTRNCCLEINHILSLIMRFALDSSPSSTTSTHVFTILLFPFKHFYDGRNPDCVIAIGLFWTRKEGFQDISKDE